MCTGKGGHLVHKINERKYFLLALRLTPETNLKRNRVLSKLTSINLNCSLVRADACHICTEMLLSLVSLIGMFPKQPLCFLLQRRRLSNAKEVNDMTRTIEAVVRTI